MHLPKHLDVLLRDALVTKLLAPRLRQTRQGVRERGEHLFVQLGFHRLLAEGPNVGQPHAVGGENASQGVQKDRGHPQGIGDVASVLPTRAAEATQRVLGDVVAALERDLLDGVSHVLNGDPAKTLGHLLRAAHIVGDLADRLRQLGETSGKRLRRPGASCRRGQRHGGRTPERCGPA